MRTYFKIIIAYFTIPWPYFVFVCCFKMLLFDLFNFHPFGLSSYRGSTFGVWLTVDQHDKHLLLKCPKTSVTMLANTPTHTNKRPSLVLCSNVLDLCLNRFTWFGYLVPHDVVLFSCPALANILSLSLNQGCPTSDDRSRKSIGLKSRSWVNKGWATLAKNESTANICLT